MPIESPLHAIGPVTGLILAGGLARRMGGNDKGLVELAGAPMVVHVAKALVGQVDALLVNANRNTDRYAALLGVAVVQDIIGEFAGPLAGMLSGLETLRGGWLLTCPCDSPLIAADLVVRMAREIEQSGCKLAVAHDGERLQPVFALIAHSLAPSLREFLNNGHRKIDRWYEQHSMRRVDFSDRTEMFVNINTPQERDELEAALERKYETHPDAPSPQHAQPREPE